MKRILLLAFAAFQVIASFGQNDYNKVAALQLVAANKEVIGLTDNDLKNIAVSSSYTVTGTGMTMVYLQQTYKGIPVFNKMKVLAFMEGKLVSNAGKFIGDMEKAAFGYSSVPSVSANEAVRLAFTTEKLPAPAISTAVTSQNGRVIDYGKPAGVTENITVELFWFPVEKDSLVSVKLGWQVQVAPTGTDNIWHVRIDALTGNFIEKINIVIFEDFNLQHKNHGAIEAGINKNITGHGKISNEIPKNTESPSLVSSVNYNVIPYPFEAPSFTSAAVQNNPWTAAPGNATTLGWHSNGTTDYTISRGNNVWATEDTLGTNTNGGLAATSTTSPDPLNFNFTPNYTVEPSRNPTMQQFCITNLFYWNNIIHDINYQYGFDEVAGNFQENNQGRGGIGNDKVMALAQSGAAGHIGNNANFATGPDGGTARMRMYLFNAVSTTTLLVNTPAPIAGNYTAIESGFSTANKLGNVGPVTGQVVYYNDDAGGTTHYACNAPVNSVTGKIALINRGFGGAVCTATVPFTTKVLNAQNAGAIAVIMVNNVAGAPIIMGGTDNTITIPAVMISQSDGAIFAAELANNVNVTLSGTLPVVLDGDLDNGIITHEYGHGISNRFTGGPATASCLQNAEQGGEGWSDYFGLMLTTNWATAATSNGPNLRPTGTYLIGSPNTGSGFRNYPYTTNLSANPLTYAHMGLGAVPPWLFSNGSEVHNTGEIWCAALWEMTWGIILQENSINPNLYNFSLAGNGGNSIAYKLVLEGLRLQPCSPGFIDARNAILTADKNLYGGRHQCAIWTAFAKRGMRYSASQGSSPSTTDQTAAFNLPPAPSITGQPIDVTVNPGDNATFTVTATAPINGAYLIYNWQVSTDGGGTWNNLAPAVTTSSLTLNAVTLSMNGYKYRCVIDQGCASTTSSVATLTVFTPGGFTFTSPAPATAACPAPATMDIILGTNAIGGFSNTITVSSTTPPAGTSVSFIPGNTVTPGNSVTVRLTGTNTLTAGSYVLTITGTASGAATQTRDITYTITPGAAPAITAQPANQTVCAGDNTSFSITSATATGFQWQVSTDGGATYNNVINGGVYAGAATATLNITGATAVLNNNRYRCIASTLCGTTTSNAAILTVNTAPAITSQPASASVCTGANQTFTVGATGTSLTYQWYISTDGGGTFNVLPNGGVYSGATTASLTITGVTAGLNNNQYRCVVTGVCPVSPLTSNAATLTVATSLSITGQPVDVTLCVGNNTSFTVTAVGAGTYQWQVSTDGGATYNNLGNGGVYSGATSAALNLTGVTAGLNGNRYRCNLTSTCGNATSGSALLTVNTLPAITAQPTDVTLCTGANNTFSVTATGTGITYQWQLSTSGCAGPWNNIAGATSAGYTLNGITAGQNNTGYRCIVTGTCAPAVTSNCALLTVVTSVTVTGQPANQTVCEGSNASFTVTGSGTGIIYQWQVSTDGGGTYNNVNNGGVYSGATSATLNITGASFSMNNNRYRCQLSNATCSTPGVSNAAILTVNTLPAISAQPQNATICVSSSNTFNVTATGTAITYQWQLSTDGGTTYNNIVGATSSGHIVSSVTAGMNGNRYRCVVTGTCTPSATSTGAILTVISPVVIATQPLSVEICSGSNTSFTVAGTGTGILYQWQDSTSAHTWATIAGATSATLNITAAATSMSGSKYRCLLSNATCTVPAVSNAAVLTVRQLPAVGLTAAPLTSLLPGQTTTLTATPSASTGGTLTSSWYRDATAFINAGNNYVADITGLGSYQVRIQESFAGGLTCFNVSPFVIISATISNKLFIFPSPNDGKFTVSYYNNGGTGTSRTVTVHDSKGAKVYNATFPVSGPYTLLSINMTPALSGIYFVVVADANGKKLAEGKVMVNW